MLITSLTNIDIDLLRLIHHHRIMALDGFLYLVSFTSSYISIGLVLGMLVISIKKKSKPLRVIFYKLLTVFIFAALISFALKNIITRERPFKVYPDIEKLSEAGSSSFPSGHTIEVFAMAVALSISFPKKKFMIPLFLWASLVAYSRMALGVHYPSDVIAGMIIGSLTGWLAPFLIKTKTIITS